MTHCIIAPGCKTRDNAKVGALVEVQKNAHVKKFSLYNESEMKRWDEFVKSHPKGTPFHLSCWMHTIYESYSFKPLFYVLKNDNNNLSGVFPCFLVKGLFNGARIVSLPFSDYCGPLFTDLYQEKKLLMKIIKENIDRVKYLEIRSPLLSDSDFICHNYYKRHVLDLNEDPNKVRKNFNKKTIKYSIRKAKMAGVVIREENSHLGIEEFYRLHMLTRKKHGIPSPPIKFFKKMFDNIIARGHGLILLATSDSKTIAAGVFFKFKEKIYYKYNASDPQYLSLKTPNHLLTWHAIEKACLKGYRFFDFGRTSPDNKGLMRYKEMWGAKRLDLPYYYYPKTSALTLMEDCSLYDMFTRIWRLLPNVFVEKIGTKIYKHFG